MMTVVTVVLGAVVIVVIIVVIIIIIRQTQSMLGKQRWHIAALHTTAWYDLA